jgi:hypothetical protein
MSVIAGPGRDAGLAATNAVPAGVVGEASAAGAANVLGEGGGTVAGVVHPV